MEESQKGRLIPEMELLARPKALSNETKCFMQIILSVYGLVGERCEFLRIWRGLKDCFIGIKWNDVFEKINLIEISKILNIDSITFHALKIIDIFNFIHLSLY